MGGTGLKRPCKRRFLAGDVRTGGCTGRTSATRLIFPWTLHGEGVDGSSPSEGLKYLQIASLCCLFRRGAGDQYGGGQRGVDLEDFFVFGTSERGSRGNLKGTGSQAESCAAGLLLDV